MAAQLSAGLTPEDPFYEFAPSTGIVPNCNLPYGPGIRVDTYLYPGCNVSGYYDSLVAKLLAWGRDFDESRIRMKNALNEFVIEGINTTIPLYKTIMEDQNFINGELSTDYLERFKLLDKMNENAKESAKKSAKAAVQQCCCSQSLSGGLRPFIRDLGPSQTGK